MALGSYVFGSSCDIRAEELIFDITGAEREWANALPK
jgi:hypothetical protein